MVVLRYKAHVVVAHLQNRQAIPYFKAVKIADPEDQCVSFRNIIKQMDQMTEGTTDQLQDSADNVERPERFLPWLVLLMAALAMLYFLDKGCGIAGQATTTLSEGRGDEVASTGQGNQPRTMSPAEVVSGAEVIGKMEHAVATGSLNPSTSYIIDDVVFLDDSAGFVEVGSKQLNGLAELMRKHEKLQIRIEAHTDNQGNDRDNLQLSVDRALAVKQYLLDRFIRPERIAVAGRGQYKPRAPNTTAAGREKNNRIEVFLSMKD